jgi:serine protease
VAARPKLYLVFWGRQWSNDPLHVRYAVLSFFARLHGSADRWGMLLSQYCQGLPINTVHCGNSGQHVVHPNSTPIAGVWFDDNASAPFAASPAQIAVEAARATLHFGNTSPAKNANAIYMVLSPHNTHPGNFGNGRFCAWHTGVETWIGVIPFINLPYVPDLGTGVCTTMRPAAPLDGFFSTVTHEYAESVTDLWPNRGWYRGRLDEIADVCTTRDGRQMLGGVAYDVQAIWSNATMSCRTN